MSQSPDANTEASDPITSLHTFQEIFQQPLLWPTTVARVRAASEQQTNLTAALRGTRVLLTGAGTSAYAASSIAAAWPRATAVPTTDLLVDTERYLLDVDVVISLARSGNSPESAGAVERVRSLRPSISHLAITCTKDSALANAGLDAHIILDARTNDRSLVMTSAFSNLVVAGLCLARPDTIAPTVDLASQQAQSLLPLIHNECQHIAARVQDRILVLSSSPLLGWASEAALKILEMTAGAFPVLTETYLGLRHGPMSFVKPDTLVLCLFSSDPLRQLYEVDLIRELRSKKLGRLVGISPPDNHAGLLDHVIPAVVPHEQDELRTPFEMVVPQLLGFHLSLRCGMNPDNPSPEGVINRVVQGVNIYSSASSDQSGVRSS